MDVTFLIGNGFDLGIGLRTSYKSFYDVYCATDDGPDGPIKDFKKSISKDYDTWADFESAFGEYAFKVAEPNDYLQAFEDFVVSFSEYLKKEEKNFDSSKLDAIINGMKRGLTSYYKIKPNDRACIEALINANPVRFNFISFNYTKCLDDCVTTLKKRSDCHQLIQGDIETVVHVHGYIDDGMVMGVNDISQIENEAFKKNPQVTEEILKPLQNQIYGMNFDTDTTKIINRSAIICVYGMSLGETDAKWWKLLIHWLQENSNHHLILLLHQEKISYTFQWKHFVNSTRNLLFAYSDITKEKQKLLEKQIHIDTDHDIFAMDLRKEAIDRSIHLVEV